MQKWQFIVAIHKTLVIDWHPPSLGLFTYYYSFDVVGPTLLSAMPIPYSGSSGPEHLSPEQLLLQLNTLRCTRLMCHIRSVNPQYNRNNRQPLVTAVCSHELSRQTWLHGLHIEHHFCIQFFIDISDWICINLMGCLWPGMDGIINQCQLYLLHLLTQPTALLWANKTSHMVYLYTVSQSDQKVAPRIFCQFLWHFLV